MTIKQLTETAKPRNKGARKKKSRQIRMFLQYFIVLRRIKMENLYHA